MDTLLISKIPNCLSIEEVKDLFLHFGSSSIKYYGTKGRMKNKAHVFYRTPEEAEVALKRLHQLDILGSRLHVEYASPRSINSYISMNEDSGMQLSIQQKSLTLGKSNEEDNYRKKISSEINSISHFYNFEYPINPELKYSYPLPTVSILTNIANALASVPKFYIQVLHLMNKMNLPAPFGSLNLSCSDQTSEEPEKLESEIESDSENIDRETKKRKLKQNKSLKIPKLSICNFQPPSSHSVAINRNEIFEESSTMASMGKKIDIIVSNDVDSRISEPIVEDQILESGFGKIFPNIRDNSNNETNDRELEWNRIDFITDEELKNKILEHEFKTLTVYKNYNEGDKTVRLYIKNLAKKVSENDLHYIYGKYVNWDSNEEKIMYDIRLMKEGKMKGQAFITLPNIEVATQALSKTNGFILFDKPMVVCFARSAKLKIS